MSILPIKEEINSNMNNIKKKRKSSLAGKKIKAFFSKRARRNSVDIKDYLKKKSAFPKNNSSPVDLCLYAMDFSPKQRNNELLHYIISYLKSLPSFMNIISKEKNLKLSENLVEQISINLHHEFIPKNNLVCRYGERGEKFYIILKGRVNFFVPKPSKCYLNFEEYVLYLMQLRRNNEFELISHLLVQNRIFYPIEDDNFDDFLVKELQEYYKFFRRFKKSNTKITSHLDFNNKLSNKRDIIDENTKKDFISNARHINIDSYEENEKMKNKKRKYFSVLTYRKMEELVDRITHPKMIFEESPFMGENSPSYYLKSNNVSNMDLDSKDRKLINVYVYEEMNSFENGQTFGYIALESKNCKRAATAIVTEDSDLGVLTKEEYKSFFEIISTREKKNLYELVNFYNLLTSVSELKFVKRFYHMFEYVKFHKNNMITDVNKTISDLIVFQSGLFIVNIFVNLFELNELITKLKIIRGRLSGISRNKIEKELEEKRENQDMIMRKNYISSNDYKILNKRFSFTLSIISDHLLIGYPDTVDPSSHKPFFNCSCISAESDGYLLSKRSIKLINEDSPVLQRLDDYCLMKIEYNLNRLQQFKKEIISKTKKKEISSMEKANEEKPPLSGMEMNKEKSFNENTIVVSDTNRNLSESKKYHSERNQIIEKKSRNNNKILLSLKFNTHVIENALNKYHYNTNKNEEIKNNREKDYRNLYNQGTSHSNNKNNGKTIDVNTTQISVIRKLKESIMKKQKKIEMKKEQYFKRLENLNNSKKIKLDKTKKNIQIYIKMKDINSFLNQNKKPESGIELTANQIKHSFSQEFLSSNNLSNVYNTISRNSYIKDAYDSYENKVLTPSRNRENKGNNQITLPSIDNRQNNNLNFNSKVNLLTDSESARYKQNKPYLADSLVKNLEMNKKQNGNVGNSNAYISYDDLYRLTRLSPSIVKEKYIIFNSQSNNTKDNTRDGLNTIPYNLKNNSKMLKPMKLKKNNLKKLQILNEDNKIDYINFVSPKINHEPNKNNLDYFIKDQYKQLNVLLKSLQKTTKEILDNKNDNN